VPHLRLKDSVNERGRNVDKRWEDEYVVDAVQARLDRIRMQAYSRENVEHPFGHALKMRMGRATSIARSGEWATGESG